MSLSSAMSAAMSGLTAASRMAEVISANIANAATPGYARRETQLGTHAETAGVSVLGIARLQDQALLADRRVATAEQAAAAGRRGFLETAEAALGMAEDTGGLTQRIADLDAAFLTAAAQPESEPLLAKAVQAAADLADRIADAARTVSAARSAADTRIGSQIGTLNTSLARVEDLNNRIMAVTAQGGDSSALQDRRQQEIDAIAQILPLREVDRGDGRIALFSAGGAPLIDGQAAVFGFTPAKQMAPELSAGAGLSGLTLNGQAVDPAGRLMSGGSLATDFAIRDRLAPDVQQGLDMLEALMRADAVTGDALLAAAGYLFVCPENLASISGLMKEMFDSTYYAALGRIEGRPYATIIAAGSDGQGAQHQIDRIATGWRLRRVAPPLIVNFAAQTPEAIAAPKLVPDKVLKQCREMGLAMAEGLSQGIF